MIALGCDMPFLTSELLQRLIDAPGAPIVAPRRDGRWEPFFARYDRGVLPVARALADQKRTTLRDLLDAAGAVELAVPDPHALDDWDTPADIATPRGGVARRDER